jgi:hypothetical protein
LGLGLLRIFGGLCRAVGLLPANHRSKNQDAFFSALAACDTGPHKKEINFAFSILEHLSFMR